MGAWSWYERAAAYLSIEGALALGFIIPFVLSINPGDFVALMFFPMTMLFAYITFFKSGVKAVGLAIILFFAGFPTFISVLLGSVRGVILSWLPVVLMVFLRLFYHSLIDRLERPSIDRIRKGAIILLVSLFLVGIRMLMGAEPEGRWYIYESWKEEESIFLTGTQVFLLTMIVSSVVLILDLIGDIFQELTSARARTMRTIRTNKISVWERDFLYVDHHILILMFNGCFCLCVTPSNQIKNIFYWIL